MKEVKYKKIKLSPHTRDKIGLFARDYDKDIYVESCVWNTNVFPGKAYPEDAEKYGYFKFNQDVNKQRVNQSVREKEFARLQKEENQRMQEEKAAIEKVALQKAQEKHMDVVEEEKLEATPPPPPPIKPISLDIKMRDKNNPIEELFEQAINEEGFKKIV